MSHGLRELIDSLRNELTECGELLALLQEQQSLIIARSSEGLLTNIELVNVQFEKISTVRQLREEHQRQYAVEIGVPAEASFADIPVVWRLRTGRCFPPLSARLTAHWIASTNGSGRTTAYSAARSTSCSSSSKASFQAQ